MRSPSPLPGGCVGGQCASECGPTDEDFACGGAEADGRRVWKEQKQEMHRRQEESITEGVQRLRVGERDVEADRAVGEATTTTTATKASTKHRTMSRGMCFRCRRRAWVVGPVRAGLPRRQPGVERRRWVVVARPKATGRGRVAETSGRWSTWSPSSGFTRMKGREWKWADVHERLLKVGVDRPADKYGKKWDNLMQQFKKVHCFQGESGKEDFFQLPAKERLARGFNFNMDRAVYEEIRGSTSRSHTIHPQNVADTGRAGGVQLPPGSSGAPESVGDGDAGGDGKDEDDSSTRGCSQTTGSPGGVRERKNMRQQTLEALTECMEKHGTLMASTMKSASKRQCSIQIRQCEAMEAELEVQKKHYAASDEVSKMMCHALMEIAKAIRDR
ncbi:hypothetical protein CBR_g84894 [Chara braunii]|uniref:Myb-like domain-containing protein n=1 Tax=Chara braunii TaxID=69332 RepID=A0A388KB30_CHABU|nr:hypothetical protein CBR_g84894 [Chara braunii]|eukprot:GBG67231.1 hypothetical protein CBR_g84894 [Chara braunii]